MKISVELKQLLCRHRASALMVAYFGSRTRIDEPTVRVEPSLVGVKVEFHCDPPCVGGPEGGKMLAKSLRSGSKSAVKVTDKIRWVLGIR